MLNLNDFPVIAAVRNATEFDEALHSQSKIIFDLNPDLFTLGEVVKTVHGHNKKLFIHLDLATGIGKDKSGLTFVSKMGVDGIISTRVNIIKMAREAGLFTVQRFFIVDSHSVDTTVEGLKSSKADTIEIMPAMEKAITLLKERVDVPIIAGGLISSSEEIASAIKAGAEAISTGNPDLWNYKE